MCSVTSPPPSIVTCNNLHRHHYMCVRTHKTSRDFSAIFFFSSSPPTPLHLPASSSLALAEQYEVHCVTRHLRWRAVDTRVRHVTHRSKDEMVLGGRWLEWRMKTLIKRKRKSWIPHFLNFQEQQMPLPPLSPQNIQTSKLLSFSLSLSSSSISLSICQHLVDSDARIVAVPVCMLSFSPFAPSCQSLWHIAPGWQEQ